jgi:two-component system chemotaxis response regulator CheB
VVIRVKKRIQTFIIDDSALVRQSLKSIIDSDPRLQVMGTAQNPISALQKMQNRKPDVILLDLEMPVMDGITFLKKEMPQLSIPVVIMSKFTAKGSNNALQALKYGAVEIIEKPELGTKKFIEESRIILCDIIRAAAQVKVHPNQSYSKIEPKLNADVILSKPKQVVRNITDTIIVMGASTGGTEALERILTKFPKEAPSTVIVQHMPKYFTGAFAKRLDRVCTTHVKEAADGDNVSKGRVLIAPGDQHILIHRNHRKYYIETREGPLVNRHRPSVDVLFRSAARSAGKNAIGIIMTGMGDDGAKGLLEMKEAGAKTFAQSGNTCVVYGMPKEAIELGAVDEVIPLDQIPEKIMGCL